MILLNVSANMRHFSHLLLDPCRLAPAVGPASAASGW